MNYEGYCPSSNASCESPIFISLRTVPEFLAFLDLERMSLRSAETFLVNSDVNVKKGNKVNDKEEVDGNKLVINVPIFNYFQSFFN